MAAAYLALTRPQSFFEGPESEPQGNLNLLLFFFFCIIITESTSSLLLSP